MYTAKEVAKYLKVSPVTIYRLVETKKLNCRKIGGQLRFTIKDLATYLEIEADEINLD